MWVGFIRRWYITCGMDQILIFGMWRGEVIRLFDCNIHDYILFLTNKMWLWGKICLVNEVG